MLVGDNNQGNTLAPPGGSVSYEWYAGDVRGEIVGDQTNRQGNRRLEIEVVARPVEFGGSNLTPADIIKQGQKGMVGALVIEAAGSTWDDSLAALEQVPNRQDRGLSIIGTRADMPITAPGVPGGVYEDQVLMVQKALNLRLADGAAVPNIASEGQGIPEDSHDAGQKGANYASEPAWFRFGIAADEGFGNAGAGGTLGAVDAELMFSNALTGVDPWTPVFTAPAGQQARMRVLMPTGVGRGTTFDRHPWQRDPYLPEGGAACLLSPTLDNCGLSSVSIGHNPLAWYLGGQESVIPGQHFDIVLPSAGGRNAASLADCDARGCDFLWRDHGSFGVTEGIWGLLRVQQ